MLLQELEITERQFLTISDMVFRHCGINLHDGKKELVRARFAKRLRQGGFDSVAKYLQHLSNDTTGREFDVLIDALSTNLTSFFRESNHFTHLAEKFLPDLMARKTGRASRRIRGWSAGCSSGEEPYTLAMTLLDTLGDGAIEGAGAPGAPGAWDVKILATDISHPVLETAIRGVYAKGRIAGVPPAFRQRYLVTHRDGRETVFAVTPQVHAMVCFNYLNLMEPWPFDGPFDFIFCRNVMIYFDKPTQQTLVNRFWDVLDSGGLLFTGHSESLTGVSHRFKYVQPTIYSKT